MGVRKEYNTTNPRIAIFLERFRKEVDRRGSIARVSEITGISRPTISFWYNGERTPDAERMIILSNKLDVSVDYLLGLTDVRNRDTTIQAVCEYTGLSEKNVSFLNRTKGSFIRRIADFLIDDARIDDGDSNTLFKLIRFFLDYDGGNHPCQRINVNGDIHKTRRKHPAARTDTIMLDDGIIENAILDEIKKRLIKAKEEQKREATNNGEH